MTSVLVDLSQGEFNESELLVAKKFETINDITNSLLTRLVAVSVNLINTLIGVIVL